MIQFDKSPKELAPYEILREHTMIHVYFFGATENPETWARHPIFGPIHPDVMYQRHEELVQVMNSRGFKHSTLIPRTIVRKLIKWRAARKLDAGYMLENKRPKFVPSMFELQRNYLEETHYAKVIERIKNEEGLRLE